MTDRRRILLLIVILIGVVGIAGGTGISLLYRAAFQEMSANLSAMARRHTTRFEALATHARQAHAEDLAAATLDLVRATHPNLTRIHHDTELRLARREGDRLVYLIQNDALGPPAPRSLPLDSPLDEPMRRALAGETGLCVGLDLRGETVLAAFQPVAGLGWGVVAKTPLAAVRQPFFVAGAIATGVSLLLITVGAWLFFRVTQPMIERLRDSEVLLARAVRFAPFPMMIHAEDGRVLLTSETWNEFTGYSPTEIGTTSAWTTLAYGVRREIVKADIDRLYAIPGRTHEGEHEVTTADGSTRIWDFSSAPLGSGADNQRLVISMAVDLTERIRAERSLRDSEQRFRTMFLEAPLGIALIDSCTGAIQEVNPRFAAIAGRSTAEMRTIDWMAITHPDDVQEDLDHMARLNAGEIAGFHLNKRYLRPDGTTVWISMTIAPLSEPQRQGRRHLCMIEDITERRRMEEELHLLTASLEQRVRERTTELEAANRELEAFSYSVSHDLRSPLRAIAGFSSALEEDSAHCLDATGIRYLTVIRRETGRMGELIDVLLRLSRLTRSPLTRTTVDLSALAAEVAAEVRQRHPDRAVELSIAAGLSFAVDRGMMRIALENLLANAWKFTSQRAQAHIEIARSGADGFLVRDDGVGFDMAYADRLFSPFQRLHDYAEFPGTGIGLATVARIIRRHGGSIRAEAFPDRGATFFITLNCKD